MTLMMTIGASGCRQVPQRKTSTEKEVDGSSSCFYSLLLFGLLLLLLLQHPHPPSSSYHDHATPPAALEPLHTIAMDLCSMRQSLLAMPLHRATPPLTPPPPPSPPDPAHSLHHSAATNDSDDDDGEDHNALSLRLFPSPGTPRSSSCLP